MKDLAVARRWFTKAADHGHKLAQYTLGEIYELGLGLGKNKKKALFWYEKSAAQHHVPAMDKMLALTGISSTASQPAPRARKYTTVMQSKK